MFPSPFARRFGMVSASFVTAHNTANGREKLSQNGTVIRKLSFAPGAAPFYLCLWRRNSCVAGDVLLWLQRCDFGTSEKPFYWLQRRKICLPCTVDLERRDYLDFLPKRPQGTTKILGTPAFAGTKTPAVLKFSSKGAATACAEPPVNCLHCGQK